jgi:DNA helicase II / ATP-dependent DNA helicase PcrA
MATAFEHAADAPWKRPPPPGDRLLDGLTPEQSQAVCHGPGVLLIVAGPGAGKTKTLIHRIAFLLAQGLAEPREILAVTFSVRAASEMRLRLSELLGEQLAAHVRAATFHSICARLLREHAQLFGRGANWTVYDQVEVRRVVDWLLSERQRTAIQQGLADFGQPAASEVLHEISLAKNRLLDPDSYEQSAGHPAAPLIAAVWRETEAELRRSNALDFDDLLVCAVRLLAEHPHYLELYRRRWRWIVVDEYQDTCQAQAVLVSLLAGPDGNLCCVCDDDQSLYAFRGADAHGLARLADRFPAHERIVLARNFRSHAEILSAAARSIQNNPNRVPKTLIAMRGPGGHATAIAFASERDEASWTATTAAQELAAGTPPAEILVLARTGYATAPVQNALAAAGIPHRVLGSLGLYERSEVRDALAYLTLIANPLDAQAFRRAVATPRRGVGERTAGQLVARAREHHDGDLIAASANAGTLSEIGSHKAREQLERFGDGLRHARAELDAGRSLGHVAIAAVTLPGGLVAHHQRRIEHSADAGQRRDAEHVLEDLRSLCRAVQAYEEREDSPTLTGFLEHARGLHARELTPGQDQRITISTIHRAKGTEARVVILAGCEERLLPSWRALEAPEQLQEERRLFYVACTRAKDQLYVTHAGTRGGRETAGPSRFLTEAGLLEDAR